MGDELHDPACAGARAPKAVNGDRDAFALTRRSFLGGVAAVGSLAALAACSRLPKQGASIPGSQTSAQTGPAKLAVAISQPAAIDPINVRDAAGLQVVFQLFDPLLRYDFEQAAPVGLAASSFEASDDAKTFTFHLRQASFHNGDPVRSEDFKRAWECIVDPDSVLAKNLGSSQVAHHLSLVDGYQSLRSGAASGLAGLECPDAQTLVVRLSAPYADFPSIAAHPALGPVPASALVDPKGFAAAPVGNGPFRMIGSWDEHAQSIELQRFEAYPSPSEIDAISLGIQPDAERAFREFQIGNLDICDCPITQYEKAKGDRGMSADGCTMEEGARLVLGSELSTYFICCNTTIEPLSNPDFRRAVSLAIDRDEICRSVFKSTRIPADDIIPPHIPGYRRGAWPYARHDPQAAAALLDKIYPKGKDGSRGVKLKLSFNPDGGHKKVMEAIIRDLADVGIDCETDTAESDVLIGRYQNRQYQLAHMDWTADYPIMDSVLFPLFHSSSLQGSNRSGFTSAEVDASINEARTIKEESSRISRFQDANTLIAQMCPIIPLMYFTHIVLGSDRISRLYIDPQTRIHLADATPS
ncbi:extracellular solute-binding protein family 5 [Coriobacterium glomerans PW2]|uniref:Extracellular solute-binding protein family 5 n=1 Tax=Coriobacterium glomerans (strain ATCC 49209 / DSM 20642 / JCM 10262 / PW2) TaxID=700015 RepID=F2N8G3_CORGP|nr:ABC transporter substrate-binding protein [Coriobacterium glomerans]AEB07346.1 extracellular solute-binding protein family 5 [Coriobacterium glomerans PW2]